MTTWSNKLFQNIWVQKIQIQKIWVQKIKQSKKILFVFPLKIFLLYLIIPSKCGPINVSNMDIATCNCQAYQSCKWSSESAKQISSGTQFCMVQKNLSVKSPRATTRINWDIFRRGKAIPEKKEASIVNIAFPTTHLIANLESITRRNRLGLIFYMQGRNHGKMIAATSAMVGRICPPWLG